MELFLVYWRAPVLNGPPPGFDLLIQFTEKVEKGVRGGHEFLLSKAAKDLISFVFIHN